MKTEQCYNSSMETSSFYTEEEMMQRKELFKKYHIVQIPDGRWRAYKDGNIMRYTSLNKLLKKLSRDQISISSIWNEFIDYKKSLTRPGTIDSYERLYNTFIEPCALSDIPLKNITVHDIKVFYTDCAKIKPIKKKYWAEIRGTVSQVFEYAREIDLVQNNPAKCVKLPENVFLPDTHISSTKKHFPVDIKNAVKDLAYEHAARFQNSVYYGIILDFQLGLRVGELCALKWCDIEDTEIHIRREAIEDGKKVIDYVKTKAGFRLIPLNSTALDILQKVKELNQSNGYPTGSDSYIFCEINAKGIISNARPHCFDKSIRRLQRKLGIADIRSMHDIRRTFATELYYAGIGISQIRAWMGHSSEAQTYQYICYRDDPEDVRKLEFIG